MIKFLKGFNTEGKIIMIICLISLIGAIVMHRYVGLPFMVFAVIGACVSMRD